MTKGARDHSFKSFRSLSEQLADEIINCEKGD